VEGIALQNKELEQQQETMLGRETAAAAAGGSEEPQADLTGAPRAIFTQI
jgi:hypothetical protein